MSSFLPKPKSIEDRDISEVSDVSKGFVVEESAPPSKPKSIKQRLLSNPFKGVSNHSSTSRSDNSLTTVRRVNRPSPSAVVYEKTTVATRVKRAIKRPLLMRKSSKEGDELRERREMIHQNHQALEDIGIQGRFDGIRLIPLPLLLHDKPAQDDDQTIHWGHPEYYSLSGSLTTLVTPAQVLESNAADTLLLEGLVPGPRGRWTVSLTPTTTPTVGPSPVQKFSFLSRFWSRSFDGTEPPSPPSQRDPAETSKIHKPWEELQKKTLSSTMSSTRSLMSGSVGAVINGPPYSPRWVQRARDRDVPYDSEEDCFCIDMPSQVTVLHELLADVLQEDGPVEGVMLLQRLAKGVDVWAPPNMQYLVGTTEHNIGILYMHQGDYAAAAASFERAAELMDAVLPDHYTIVPRTQCAIALLAMNLYDDCMGHWQDALDLATDGSFLRSKLLCWMAVARSFTGEIDISLDLMKEALEIQRKWLNATVTREWMVRDASVAIYNTAQLYLRRGDFVEARELLEDVQALLASHSVCDSWSASVELALARSLLGCQEVEQAIYVLEKARSGQCKEPLDVVSVEIVGTLAFLRAKQMQTDESLALLQLVHHWQQKELPCDHPSVALARTALEQIGK